MTKDEIDKIRILCDESARPSLYVMQTNCERVLDAIEEVMRERDMLLASVKNYQEACNEVGELRAALQRARSERDRYREATTTEVDEARRDAEVWRSAAMTNLAREKVRAEKAEQRCAELESVEKELFGLEHRFKLLGGEYATAYEMEQVTARQRDSLLAEMQDQLDWHEANITGLQYLVSGRGGDEDTRGRLMAHRDSVARIERNRKLAKGWRGQ